jgi:hypothetical protein
LGGIPGNSSEVFVFPCILCESAPYHDVVLAFCSAHLTQLSKSTKACSTLLLSSLTVGSIFLSYDIKGAVCLFLAFR